MGRSKALLMILSIFPVLMTFNNCSRSSGLDDSVSTSSAFLELQSNDGGFPGKIQYEYFVEQPNCDAEFAQASRSLYVDFQGELANQVLGPCLGDSVSNIDFSQISSNGYNPYATYFDGRIWVNPKLHDGINDQLFYKEFCFNEVLQMDLVIQHISQVVSGGGTKKSWVAVTLYGESSASPGILFHGGYYEQSQDGSRLFFAKNETFELVIEGEGESFKRRGLLSRKDGVKIPMKCWVNLKNN